MVNIIKKNKELLILIGILLAIGICVEMPSWIKGGYFVGGGDIKTQWYPFYVLNRRETINALKSGNLPFYSWILFLGNNIWASKISYGFVDIFNLIFYLCRENYFWIYGFQVILKILTAGITAFLFFSYTFNNKKKGLIGGLLFASSSYLLYFSSQSSFMSVVALSPLYLLGIEKFIRENKHILFTISVTLLLLTNYYLFFSLTLISPFYYLYRYYNINNNLKGIFKSVIKIILYYFVGLMISAVFILPSFFYVLQNERVGYMNSDPLFYDDIKIYLNVLYSMFVPSDLSIYGNNIYFFDSHELKEVCIFVSSFVTPLVPQIFISKNKKFRISTILMYLVFGLFLFIPYFSSIMNGSSSICFRWTYILSIFNILIALSIDDYSNKSLIITLIIICLGIVALFVIGYVFTGDSINKYFNQMFISLICIVFLIIYTILLIKNKKLVIFLLIIEIIVHSFTLGIRCIGDSVKKEDIDAVTTVLYDPNNENIREYLNDLDPNNKGEFYRIYVPYKSLFWSFSRNMNLLYGFNGTKTYDSTYEPSFSDMINIKNEGIVQEIYWDFDIDDPELLNFISCKYAFTINKEEIPFNNYEILDNNYLNGIIISKNLNYRAIGETYSKREESANRDFSNLNKYIISDDKEIDSYLLSKENNKLEDVEYQSNVMKAKITSDDNSFVVLKLSYDDGFKIKVNDKLVKTYKCNGGMIGFPIEKGQNNILIEFVPKGFNDGIVISCIGIIIFTTLLFKKKIICLISRQHN